jgi:hypothetical protein
MPAKPKTIIAHVDGSGTVSVVRQFETDQAFLEERLWLIRVRV